MIHEVSAVSVSDNQVQFPEDFANSNVPPIASFWPARNIGLQITIGSYVDKSAQIH
jgi:hypothetical protein